MDSFFIDHIRDLSKRSEDKCIFTFSNFLNGEEINELNITQKITNNYIYTLSGCRVENKNMAPGIYIKNRKKYIIRK